MSLISFDRLLGILETVCEIILAAIKRIKSNDPDDVVND